MLHAWKTEYVKNLFRNLEGFTVDIRMDENAKAYSIPFKLDNGSVVTGLHSNLKKDKEPEEKEYAYSIEFQETIKQKPNRSHNNTWLVLAIQCSAISVISVCSLRSAEAVWRNYVTLSQN